MKKAATFFLSCLILSSALASGQNVTAAVFDNTDKEEWLQHRIEERNQLREEKRLEIEAKIQEKIAEREQKKEQIQERVEERKASAAAKLAKRKQERIRLYFGRLVDRLDATINRLNILIDRIESRLVKINEEAEYVDTSDISEQLEDARLLLDQASAELLATQDNLETMLESEDPKAAFEAIREVVKEIRDLLKEVHSILVHTIGDIRGLRVGNTGDGDMTTTVTPEPTVEVTETPTTSE